MNSSRAVRLPRTAGCLAAALFAAKVLATTVVPVAPAGVLPLLLDDVAVAGGGALVLAALPLPCARLLLASLFMFTVLSMLAMQAMGQPFLPSMLAGCAPAMGDSLLPYLTVANAARVLAVLGAGVLGVWLGGRVVMAPVAVLLVTLLAAGGAALAPSPACAGHRNALVAFGRALLPRGVAATHVGPTCIAAAGAPLPLGLPAGIAAGRSVVLVVLESAASRFVDPPAGQPTAMPFLRELAAAGLDCPQAMAVYPESIEGQVAILCGLAPCPDAEPGDYSAHARWSLPHRLAAHGYRSALFHAGRFDFLGMRDVLSPMGFDVLADAATIGGEAESSFGIDEESTVDALLSWLDRQGQAQVLACWLPIAGHHPYSSPQRGPFGRDTMLGCYQNALHYADSALARLWAGMCARRPAEQWLLCVVGDHGQAFGEHPGNFGHSFQLFDENLRVPLVVVAPGTALAGRRHEAPCSHLDVVPTLLDLLGCGPERRAVVPAPAVLEPVCAFTDWGELLVAVRAGRWKLIRDVGAGRDQLFDVVRDPGERCDLGGSEAERVVELRATALAFLAAVRRLPPPVP